MKPPYHFLVALSLCAFTHSVTAAEPYTPYQLIHEIPVGGEGGWDYLSVDAAAHRLYVSHATKVVVIDLTTDKVVGEIEDTPGVHGIAIAPDLSRAFCSNGKEGKVSVVDTSTLKTLSKVTTGQNPDAILFEPAHHEVYAFNGRGRSATVFEASSGKVTATIPLDGKPEFAAVDPAAGMVFDNLEDKSSVVAIDSAQHTVAKTWPVAPGEEPSGLAIDREHHRLFIGCGNELMLMMDSTTGQVVATVPIDKGVDATWFDEGTQLAFSSCGSGTVTIAHEDSPSTLTVVQKLATAPGARTMALDPSTHKIYLATAQYLPSNAGSAATGKRRQIAPGSFKILVYGTTK